jgi:transposase-like protein
VPKLGKPKGTPSVVYTEEIVEAAVASYKNGSTVAEVSKATGISTGTIQRWVKAAGANRTGRKQYTDELVDEVIAKYIGGMNIKALSEEYGMAEVTIRKWVESKGITPQTRTYTKRNRVKNEFTEIGQQIKDAVEVSALAAVSDRFYCTETYSKTWAEAQEMLKGNWSELALLTSMASVDVARIVSLQSCDEKLTEAQREFIYRVGLVGGQGSLKNMVMTAGVALDKASALNGAAPTNQIGINAPMGSMVKVPDMIRLAASTEATGPRVGDEDFDKHMDTLEAYLLGVVEGSGREIIDDD